jgi:hypothetical protein
MNKLIPCATKALLFSTAFCFSFALCPREVRASAFTAGDLVVVEVGTGAALNGNATAASLLEYSTLGSLVQTINLPTGATGLTLSGTATSEGFLTLSTDGNYLTMGGYAATPGTATPQTSTPAAVNRVVGRIDMSGNINISTALTDAYSGSNIRSAVSTDGNSLWTAGNGGSGQGATAGVRYTTLGSTTSTLINPTSSNMRVVNIFNGQLYASSSTGTLLGVSTVGTGEPTTSIGGAPTALPGMPTTGTHSAYDFWFMDANTLYVADDGTAANGGGIQKWTLSGGTWTLQYTLLNNGTTTTGIRGLAGTVDGSGNAILFGTTSATLNSLIEVTDTGAGSTATTLATVTTGYAFRGVEFLPVPEPSSIALVLGGLTFLGWTAKRRK